MTVADPRRETQAAPITTAPIDLRVASAASVFGRETVDNASGPASPILTEYGRRVGSLGPGLTSDPADAARAVLRDDPSAGSQVFWHPPALPVRSAWPGQEAGVHRSDGQRVRAIPHQRKGRH